MNAYKIPFMGGGCSAVSTYWEYTDGRIHRRSPHPIRVRFENEGREAVLTISEVDEIESRYLGFCIEINQWITIERGLYVRLRKRLELADYDNARISSFSPDGPKRIWRTHITNTAKRHPRCE